MHPKTADMLIRHIWSIQERWKSINADLIKVEEVIADEVPDEDRQ